MSDTALSQTQKINHLTIRALIKGLKSPPPRPPESPINPQLKPHTLNIIMGRTKIREVKKSDQYGEIRIQQGRITKGTRLRDLAILYSAPH